jgi:hypothetical protein
MRRFGPFLAWTWRGALLVAVVSLLLSAFMRSRAGFSNPAESDWRLLASVGDRATGVALASALLSVGSRWRNLVTRGQQLHGWSGLILIAIVAGIGGIHWSVEEPSAPLLIVFTLLTASMGLWAAGEALTRFVEGRNVANGWASGVAFAALMATILVVGAVNWRVWGTPAGIGADAIAIEGGPQGAFLGLLAVGLISTAGLGLRKTAARFVCALAMLATALLIGIALSVQWTMPFS